MEVIKGRYTDTWLLGNTTNICVKEADPIVPLDTVFMYKVTDTLPVLSPSFVLELVYIRFSAGNAGLHRLNRQDLISNINQLLLR